MYKCDVYIYCQLDEQIVDYSVKASASVEYGRLHHQLLPGGLMREDDDTLEFSKSSLNAYRGCGSKPRLKETLKLCI